MLLNQSDENRLNAIRHVVNRAIQNRDSCVTALSPDTVKWLADTLKEMNDELSQVTQELHKANEENVVLHERFY
jgi:hypothetical protein